MKVSILSVPLLLVPTAFAHGRITNITTSSGVVYEGWDPASALPDGQPSGPLAAWSADNLGNIFVPPSRVNTSDITCHYNATPGALHVNTTAGDTMRMQWVEWPFSHKGPVLTYMAACNQSCADADKTKLRWVKIDQLGWLNSTGSADYALSGTWASDVLRANDASWTVKIPGTIAPGAYVIRHEIIALHIAEQPNGAQLYPQCVNVRVEGGETTGDNRIEGGLLGSELYKFADPGILLNIHANITGYTIPGPGLWQYATPYRQASL